MCLIKHLKMFAVDLFVLIQALGLIFSDNFKINEA